MDIELHLVQPHTEGKYGQAGLDLPAENDACADCTSPLTPSGWREYAIVLSGTGYWYLCEACVVPVSRPQRLDYFGKNFGTTF